MPKKPKNPPQQKISVSRLLNLPTFKKIQIPISGKPINSFLGLADKKDSGRPKDKKLWAEIGTFIINPILALVILFWCSGGSLSLLGSNLPAILVMITPLIFPQIFIELLILNKKNIENHKKTLKKNQYKYFQDEATTKHTPLEQVKYLISLSPIIISVPFILVAEYYKDAFGGNTNFALQVASLKLSQNQQIWIVEAILILAIIYLTLLPSILMLPSSKFGTHIIFNNESANQHENWHKLYIYICIQLAIFSLIPAQLLSFIFNTLNSEYKISHLSRVLSFSFFIAQITIGYSMLKTIQPEYFTKPHNIVANKSYFIKFLAFFLIACLPLISFTNDIKNIRSDLGKLMAGSEIRKTNSTSSYSCIFSGSRQNPEPRAFGVIISTNASSIHMFTPNFDEENQKYDSPESSKNLSAKGMTESHLEIKKDYYFENYDSSKHYYNDSLGVCEYIIPLSKKLNILTDQKLSTNTAFPRF